MLHTKVFIVSKIMDMEKIEKVSFKMVAELLKVCNFKRHFLGTRLMLHEFFYREGDELGKESTKPVDLLLILNFVQTQQQY